MFEIWVGCLIGQRRLNLFDVRFFVESHRQLFLVEKLAELLCNFVVNLHPSVDDLPNYLFKSTLGLFRLPIQSLENLVYICFERCKMILFFGTEFIKSSICDVQSGYFILQISYCTFSSLLSDYFIEPTYYLPYLFLLATTISKCFLALC